MTKFLSAGAQPLHIGEWLTPRNALPHMGFNAEFHAVGQTVRAYMWRTAYRGHLKSSELTWIDDFLLVIHSILNRFQDIARYLPKIANFSYPVYLAYRLGVFVTPVRLKNN